MKSKKGKFNKKSQNPINKLSLFQKNDAKFMRKCPFSKKDAPEIDYKNVKLLEKYISEKGKIIPSRISFVSSDKQRKLSREIKKARTLALISHVGKYR